jgi:hypothetical protein
MQERQFVGVGLAMAGQWNVEEQIAVLADNIHEHRNDQ